MKVLFVGSSLYQSSIDLSDLVVRPPASQGDVQQAVADGATAIGLVDGEFGQHASVWHKEILLALWRGVPVLGASSMGALRFAECAQFGMIGVGKIAADYASGVLDDDADVALLMAPAELSYAPLTEPLVDVVSTLDNLLLRGVLTKTQCAALLRRARSLHFTERTDEVLFESYPEGGDLLQSYRSYHVSQKRLDAEELVSRLRSLDVGDWDLPHFTLNQSPFWSARTA